MSGRVALVAGASRGIGRATAIRVAQDFDVVAIVARSAEVLADVAQALRTNGGTAFPIALDLAVPESAAAAVDRIVDRFERLDAVAAIAGAVSQADVFELSDAEWDAALALKFHSALRLTLAASPSDQDPRRGCYHLRGHRDGAQRGVGGGQHDQDLHCGTCQGIRRPWHARRRAGERAATGAVPDRPAKQDDCPVCGAPRLGPPGCAISLRARGRYSAIWNA